MTDNFKSRRDAVAIIAMSEVHAERDLSLTADQLQRARKVLRRAGEYLIKQGAHDAN